MNAVAASVVLVLVLMLTGARHYSGHLILLHTNGLSSPVSVVQDTGYLRVELCAFTGCASTGPVFGMICLSTSSMTVIGGAGVFNGEMGDSNVAVVLPTRSRYSATNPISRKAIFLILHYPYGTRSQGSSPHHLLAHTR